MSWTFSNPVSAVESDTPQIRDGGRGWFLGTTSSGGISVSVPSGRCGTFPGRRGERRPVLSRRSSSGTAAFRERVAA